MQRFVIGFLTLLLYFSCATTKVDLVTEERKLQQIMNDWHKAAATADEDTFFNTLASDGFYIGTDASERWTGSEMKAWSKQYFDRESAWTFTTKERNIKFSANGKTAWFDELLDTWMGVCRGSGVLVKNKGQWKLVHYHLAIAVPNDKVQDYLKLIAD